MLAVSGDKIPFGQPILVGHHSEKRARRVRDYLVGLGIATDRIKVFGLGETNFRESNSSSAGRAKNRRIEIVFYK